MDHTNHIKRVSKNLNLKPDQKLIERLNQEWNNVLNIIKVLNTIDTSSVLPLVHVDPTPQPISHLREDSINFSPAFSEKIPLTNACKTKNNYIKINKVISSD